MIALFLIAAKGHALPLSFSQNEIDFGIVEIDEPQTADIWVKNIFDREQIISISLFQMLLGAAPQYLQEITLSDTLLTIAPEDSVLLNISFTALTNIQYRTALVFTNQYNHSPVYLQLSAECHLPDNLYPTTYNLFDNELKVALYTLVINHTWIGYDNARNQMYSWIDNVDGYVECVYTGTWVHEDDIPGGAMMQCEHTWPQSMGANVSPPRSDLHHLYPTTSNSNNIRGNLPFGVVTGTPNWEVGGSKRGINSLGIMVFEPRDEHKGAAARSMFYFAIRYDNPSAPFFNNQENILKVWNRTHNPVERDLIRNTSIATIQQKRNPFVDHPHFADRIYSIATQQNTPEQIDFVYQNEIYYTDSGAERVALYNNSTITINISEVTTNLQEFYIVDYSPTLPPQTVGFIDVFIYYGLDEPMILTLDTDIGTHQIYLRQLIVTDTDDTIPPANTVRLSVYPNPVRSEFYIKAVSSSSNISARTNDYSPLHSTQHHTISIYNLRGQKVLSKKVDELNTHIKMPQHLSSGIYFVRVNNQCYSKTTKFLYIK